MRSEGSSLDGLSGPAVLGDPLPERPGCLCTQGSLASALHLRKEIFTLSACITKLLFSEEQFRLRLVRVCSVLCAIRLTLGLLFQWDCVPLCVLCAVCHHLPLLLPPWGSESFSAFGLRTVIFLSLSSSQF